MSAHPAGYSGKPLWQKLGIKPGMRVLPVNAPDHYGDVIDGAEGMEEVVSGPAEMVHLFCETRADLDADSLRSTLADLDACRS